MSALVHIAASAATELPGVAAEPGDVATHGAAEPRDTAGPNAGEPHGRRCARGEAVDFTAGPAHRTPEVVT